MSFLLQGDRRLSFIGRPPQFLTAKVSTAHSIQNHSRQAHALGHHGGETRRRAAYIRVPRQTNGRYDRGGNDQCRLHSRLLLHLLRPGLPLPRNCSLHFAHQCTTDRTGLGQVCTRACRERSRMEDSFSSLRRVGTARQSRYPASCPPAPECFHRISCSRP